MLCSLKVALVIKLTFCHLYSPLYKSCEFENSLVQLNSPSNFNLRNKSCGNVSSVITDSMTGEYFLRRTNRLSYKNSFISGRKYFARLLKSYPATARNIDFKMFLQNFFCRAGFLSLCKKLSSQLIFGTIFLMF